MKMKRGVALLLPECFSLSSYFYLCFAPILALVLLLTHSPRPMDSFGELYLVYMILKVGRLEGEFIVAPSLYLSGLLNIFSSFFVIELALFTKREDIDSKLIRSRKLL